MAAQGADGCRQTVPRADWNQLGCDSCNVSFRKPDGRETSDRKRVVAVSLDVTMGGAPEGRDRRATGGESPFVSLVRGCCENLIGDTHRVFPFRRVLPRHIPALGCSSSPS
jgi:hypothetical protein